MSPRGTNQEVEVKIRIGSGAEGRRLLRSRGFRVLRRRHFEANTVFDTAPRELRRAGVLLRLRQVPGRCILTYKGRPQPAKHKSREEIELEVADAGTMARILECLAFQPVFQYEKYRTEYWSAGDEGVIALDETPIGVFLELEGPPDWIDATASRLEFEESSYITESYGSLYLADCRRRQVDATHMIFGSGSS